MDPLLSPDELRWLSALDTDSPVKPDVPRPVRDRLVEHGFAIELVEGGLQLTSLGRSRLEKA
jgi:hypothetical protein